MRRRRFLLLPAALALSSRPGRADAAGYPVVVEGAPIVLPRDHGAHPDFRTEWWYVTGWLNDDEGRECGFQVTFFRSRPMIGEDDPSAWAPRQLMFAHAAIADADAGRLIHDQRSARAVMGLAGAATRRMAVHLDDWSLAQEGDRLIARIAAREFRLNLSFTPSQAVVLQGNWAYSRKGPERAQASYYISWPQLQVNGSLSQRGRERTVRGRAWLDHEWSSSVLTEAAVGWDWCGINAGDGSALMAFRIRGRDGSVLWAGGSLRDAAGRLQVFAPRDVRFHALSTWRSPRTGASYPIPMRIEAGGRSWTLQPLMDDQELDASASTGTVYWEGAVRASREGTAWGKGYLELTGYHRPLKL